MPELTDQKQIFSLREVGRSIKKTLEERYKKDFWVKAEINKLNLYKHSGHCYPELVEKQEGKIIAQFRSYLWKEDYRRINNKFLEVLREPLKDGIKVLFLCRITFDASHGLALWIIDIDPAYSLGDLEREKQETISKLQAELIFNTNKSVPFPLLPQRIAIISVESSKGYADFTGVIDSNPWHYKFFYNLFPSVLQGDNAVESIRKQLNRIRKVKEHFDVVAIIRGGGGEVGLSCYNNYELARDVALFPIPVITGIGHATNETVAEMVSYSNAITPTKLAENLLQHFHNFSVPVKEAQNIIIRKSSQLLNDEKQRFGSQLKYFRSAAEKMISRNKHFLGYAGQAIGKDVNRMLAENNRSLLLTSEKLNTQAKQFLKVSSNEIVAIERNVQNMHPKNVLKRGFSITYLNGKSVKSITQVNTGDTLHTEIVDGSVNSLVDSIQVSSNE